MLHPLIMSLLASASQGDAFSALNALWLSGLLDLAGLAVGLWTLWSSIWLPLGGSLQRAFRFIAWGALAFAASHLLDSLMVGVPVLTGSQGFVLTQGNVLISTIFFVPGFAGLIDALPAPLDPNHPSPPVRFWPVAVMIMIAIGALSFIIYGFTPEAEIIALIGLDGSLLAITTLCIILVLKARIGGIVGHSLWLTLLGMLLFSLAHPLQIWLVEESDLSGTTLSVLHRLIVIPALILFALSITRLTQRISQATIVEAAQPALPDRCHIDKEQAAQHWSNITRNSPRTRAQSRRRGPTGRTTVRHLR